MNNTKPWFDNDRFWQIFYHTMFDPASFAQARRETPQLLALAGLENPRILDLACGPGRHAVPLAAMGLKVTGVDLSAYLLEKAQSLAEHSGVSVDWQQQDMREQHNPAGYDLILNLFSSFGYFDDWQDNQRVLQRCHENLRDGGVLIIDLHGKEQILRDLQPVHAQEFDNPQLADCVLYQRPVLSDDLSRINNEWTLVCPDATHRHSYSHFIYTACELKLMAQQAGFADTRVYGSLDGQAYDLDAERLVLVARKDTLGS
jgi:SAM-dependent methyltransferase